MMEDKYLVSVVVITYNSSATVVELLESIKLQTYRAIEIIVSDDCSTDNSVELCQLWRDANPEQKMKIVCAQQNSGVSGNLNRGVKVAIGKWIKIMAADDLLFDYSIQAYVDYATLHQSEVCISKLHMFGTNDCNIAIKQKFYNHFFDKYNKINPPKHYELLLKECLLPAPGMFITKRLLEEIGLFDERFPFAEEWPTYLSILKRGYDILYFDQELILYRCEGNTLGSDNKNRLSLRVFKDTVKSFKEFRRPLMFENRMYLQAWIETINLKIMLIGYKECQSMLDRLQVILLRLINPQTYISLVSFFSHQSSEKK